MVQEASHRLKHLFAAIVLLVLAMPACKNDLDNVAALELPQDAPDRVTSQAEYLFTDSGRVRNKLRAGRIAEWTTEPKHTELSEGLELVFLDSIGNATSVLKARRGTIRPKEHLMEVYEEVVFVNAKGERLETEQLTWDQDSGRVHTDKAVRVERGANVIHGQGLDAIEDFSRYTIRRITGVLHLEPEDTLATDAPDQ